MSLQTTEQYLQDVIKMKKKHALELLSNALNADVAALENALSVAVNADLTEVELQPARLALQCRCALLLRNLGSASDAGNPGGLRDAIDEASLVTAGTPEGVTCNQAVEHARVRLEKLQESRRKVQKAVDMALSARSCSSWPKVLGKVVSEAHSLGLASQVLVNASVIRKMCMTQVRVPRKIVAAFIGPKGANIRSFEAEHGVQISFAPPSDELATEQVAYVFLRSDACQQFLKLSPESLQEPDCLRRGVEPGANSLRKAESCLVRWSSLNSQSQPIQRDLGTRAKAVPKFRSECERRSSTESVVEPSQRRRASVVAPSHGKRDRFSRSRSPARSHSTSENAQRGLRSAVTSDGASRVLSDAGLGKALASAAANAQIAAAPKPATAHQAPNETASPVPTPPAPIYSRAAMVKQLFAALDKGRCGRLGSSAMRFFVEMNGFDGTDDDWAEEFDAICEDWECDVSLGFAEEDFTQWVNDESDRGCFCQDRKLAIISAKLAQARSASAASGVVSQAELRERSRGRSPPRSGHPRSDRHQQRRRRAHRDDVRGGPSTSRRLSSARDSNRSRGRRRSRRPSSARASRRSGA